MLVIMNKTGKAPALKELTVYKESRFGVRNGECHKGHHQNDYQGHTTQKGYGKEKIKGD